MKKLLLVILYLCPLLVFGQGVKPTDFPLKIPIDGTEELYTQKDASGIANKRFLVDQVKDYVLALVQYPVDDLYTKPDSICVVGGNCIPFSSLLVAGVNIGNSDLTATGDRVFELENQRFSILKDSSSTKEFLVFEAGGGINMTSWEGQDILIVSEGIEGNIILNNANDTIALRAFGGSGVLELFGVRSNTVGLYANDTTQAAIFFDYIGGPGTPTGLKINTGTDHGGEGTTAQVITKMANGYSEWADLPAGGADSLYEITEGVWRNNADSIKGASEWSAYQGTLAGSDLILQLGDTAGSVDITLDVASEELTIDNLDMNVSNDIQTSGIYKIYKDETYNLLINHDNVTQNTTYQLPDTNGTFVMSVNGTLADVNGNVTIAAGGSPDSSLSKVDQVLDGNRIIDVNGNTLSLVLEDCSDSTTFGQLATYIPDAVHWLALNLLGVPEVCLGNSVFTNSENARLDDGLTADKAVDGGCTGISAISYTLPTGLNCGEDIDSVDVIFDITAINDTSYVFINNGSTAFIPLSKFDITATGETVIRYSPRGGIFFGPSANAMDTLAGPVQVSLNDAFTSGSPVEVVICSKGAVSTYSLDQLRFQFYTTSSGGKTPVIKIDENNVLKKDFVPIVEIPEVNLDGKADTTEVLWENAANGGIKTKKDTTDYLKVQMKNDVQFYVGDESGFFDGFLYGDFNNVEERHTIFASDNSSGISCGALISGSDTIPLIMGVSKDDASIFLGGYSDGNEFPNTWKATYQAKDVIVMRMDMSELNLYDPKYDGGGQYTPVVWGTLDPDSTHINSTKFVIGNSIHYYSDTLVNDVDYDVEVNTYCVGYSALTATRNIDLSDMERGQEIIVHDFIGNSGTNNITFSESTPGSLPPNINITTNNGFRRIRRLTDSNGNFVVIGRN